MNLTCVKRAYTATKSDYIPVADVPTLVLGETLYTGEFQTAYDYIPGPFSKGVAASQRLILVPAGPLTESVADPVYMLEQHPALRNRSGQPTVAGLGVNVPYRG